MSDGVVQSPGRCPEPCGKVRYTSRALARKAISQIAGGGRASHLRPHRCRHFDGFWHATSASAETVAWYREADARQARKAS